MFCLGQSHYTLRLSSIIPNPNNKKSSTLVLGDKVVFGSNKCIRRLHLQVVKAVEKDSEERDIVKAREALRKLDDQLLSLSNKQLSTPKIRAKDLKQTSLRGKEEASEEITGSFLTYTASFLLVFTIIYNVVFLTIIKPSVDGPETLQYANIKNEAPQKIE
ncbi:hypothetical protein ACS0TY_026354 [Phlomoides rotata]